MFVPKILDPRGRPSGDIPVAELPATYRANQTCTGEDHPSTQIKERHGFEATTTVLGVEFERSAERSL